MMKPEATRDVIEQAAELLMGSQGKTSSLDVKQYLRGKNYWVKQRSVSAALQSISEEKNWKVSFNGTYNEYSAQGKADVSEAVIDEIERHSNLSVSDSNDDLRTDLGLDDLEILTIMESLEEKFKIDFNIAGEPRLSTRQDFTTVGSLITETERLVAAIPASTPVAAAPTTPPVTGKRNPKAVINDSATPSRNPRVTVNMDPKLDSVPLTGVRSGLPGIDDNDWVMYSHNCVCSEMAIYDGKYSRDHVRTVYARLRGIKIQDTRSCRVKNYLQ